MTYALNIAANPHPPGIYIKLLEYAARGRVRVRGDNFAKITKPLDRGDSIYVGRILLWTEINIDGDWLDLESEDSLDDNDKGNISIPPNAKPNYRAFNYVFDEKSHRMYFESKNEFHESLGASTAQRLFAKILSLEFQPKGSPEVEVTVVPDEGAVGRVLSLPGLRHLRIRVVLPNPDSPSDKQRRVFDELKKARARMVEETYTKEAGAPKLVPTPRMTEMAEVGAENGYVRGEGRAADGKKLEASTDSQPKRYYVDHDKGDTFAARLLGTLRLRR